MNKKRNWSVHGQAMPLIVIPSEKSENDISDDRSDSGFVSGAGNVGGRTVHRMGTLT